MDVLGHVSLCPVQATVFSPLIIASRWPPALGLLQASLTIDPSETEVRPHRSSAKSAVSPAHKRSLRQDSRTAAGREGSVPAAQLPPTFSLSLRQSH